METKEFKVNIPKGYEIDRENSTFECIKFKKVKPVLEDLTYNKIAYELFMGKSLWFIDSRSNIVATVGGIPSFFHPNNSKTLKQSEKILAINKLMNIAVYFNGDWVPEWGPKNNEFKYRIKYDTSLNVFFIVGDYYINHGAVYFKSEKAAKKAIEILGEDELLKIFS